MSVCTHKPHLTLHYIETLHYQTISSK